MKWINYSVKEYLLLFFVLFFVVDGYGQKLQSDYDGKPAGELNGDFNDYGDDINDHKDWGSLKIIPHANKEPLATEGSLAIEYFQLKRYSSGGWINVGPFATNVRLYKYGSLESFFGPTSAPYETNKKNGGIPLYQRHGNILTNIPGSGDNTINGWFFIGDIGPSREYKITVQHQQGSGGSNSGKNKTHNFHYNTGTTAKLKNASTFTIETNSNTYQKVLKWTKGTNYRGSFVSYKIYQKQGNAAATLLTTVNGNDSQKDYSYTIPTLPDGDYSFSIRTVLSSNAPSDWNKNEDDTEDIKTVSASYTTNKVNATADLANKIRVKWKSVNSVLNLEGLVVFRDGEEVAQLTKSALEYVDNSPIPGFNHSYRVELQNANGTALPANGGQGPMTATGNSLPNGRISGSVKTSTGAALSGVEITLSNADSLYTNHAQTGTIIGPNTVIATAITDNAGFYTFSDIYYNQKAKFVVKARVPWSNTERLEVNNITKTLDVQENIIRDVNFVDTASFAITGYVYYPSVGGDSRIKLPVVGAKIFIDGIESGIQTDNKGYYNQAIAKVGAYRFQVKVDGHHILPEANFSANQEDSVQLLRVDRNLKMNNFVDKTLKPAYVYLEAYGGAPIGESGILGISSQLEVAKELQTDGFTRLDHSIGTLYAIDTLFNSNYVPRKDTISFEQVGPAKVKIMLPPIDFTLTVKDVRSKIAIQGSQNNTSIQRDALKMDYFNSGTNGVKDLKLSVQDSSYVKNGKDSVLRPIDKHLYFTYFNKIQVVVDTLNDDPSDVVSVFPKEYLKRVNNFAADYNVAEQRDKIAVRFKMYHLYEYDGHKYNYPLDTGKITITDAIGDIKDPIVHNFSGDQSFDYPLVIGAPRIELPWVKYITVIGELAGKQHTFRDSVIVLGERARMGTFYTRGPEKTHFVLHDPPGDNSYSTLEKGTTLSWSNTSTKTFGGGAGAYTDSKIGMAFGNMFTLTKTGAAMHISATIQAGKNNTDEVEENYELTLAEEFSTSGDANFVGEDADLFVGSSSNSTYSLTDILAIKKLDANTVQITPDTVIMLDNMGFNTTFAYTQMHIRETLLPQLKTLYSITQRDSLERINALNQLAAELSIRYNKDVSKIKADKEFIGKMNLVDETNENLTYYRSSIREWERTLANNKKNRELAKDRILTLSGKEPGKEGANGVFLPGGIAGKNISFSAGMSYENTVQIDSTESKSSSDEVYFSSEIAAGFYTAADEGFNDVDVGALVTINNTETNTKIASSSTSNVVSFFLSDDDPGDYFSVDIGSDPTYGTPVFTTVAGASSCPPEDGTQRRFMALMENEGTAVVNNVPATESAKFKIRITNRSESDEEGTFGIRLISTSNLNGAKVLVGGQDVTNLEALYTIPTGKPFIVPVEVIKGPIDNEYNDLTLVMYPSCEQTLSESEKIGDYSESDTKSFAKISATFQPNCSEVDLFLPGEDWLINQNHNDELNVVFSKYDASETSPLEYLQLEYRRLNTGGTAGEWQKLGDPIYKTALDQPQKQLVYNIAQLLDGNYQLRAYVSCTYGVNYSPVYAGKIDRKSALLFGLPSPSNGILTRQDIVSVDYNKNIRNDKNNPVKTKLVNTQTGEEIPSKVVLNGKRIQILTTDPTHLDRLENQELEASIWNVIDDESGNLVQDTVTWRFVVSRSNLYWSPNSISINVEEGSTGLFTSTIKNKTALSQDFSLSQFPTYITPTMRNGKVSPQGEVKVDFSISNTLNTGSYTDTLHVTNDGKEQFLYLTVHVLKKAPNWQVDKSKFKYSMNIVSQFSLNDQDTPLSDDTFDKVAAFVGDEVRGVAQIEYDANMDKYYAFVTAYTNDLKEKLDFRFWDARPGIEYVAKESESFVNGGVLGVAKTPFILHPKEVVQTIPLEKGWNWVSLYLENTDMSVQNVLSSMKPNSGTQISSIISAGDMSEYNREVGWAGTLKNMELYKAYRIYVDKADTLVWTGQFAKEASVLPLHEGWNSLGYPMPFNTALNSYLENVPFADGTRIMSQDEFAVYDAATQKWTGSLKYLRPNKGYRLSTTSDASAFGYSTYADYQAAGNSIKADLSATALPRPVQSISGALDANKHIDLTAYDGSVNTVYALNIGGENVNSENAGSKVAKANSKQKNYSKLASVTAPVFKSNTDLAVITGRFEIMSYVGDQLIGISQLQGLSNGEIRGFMSSGLSDDLQGKKLRYVIYDALEDKTYNALVKEQLTASDGARHGSIDQPLVLAIEGDSDLELTSDIAATTISLGETVQYEIRVNNIGDATAIQVAVQEQIPTGFEIINVASSTGKVAVNNGQWNYSTININKGATDRIKVELKGTLVGVYSLGNAEVAANNDANPSNNKLYGKEVEVIDARSNASKVFIPGFMSPNGDGINDRFEIVGLGEFIKGVSVIIYDKSSNVIYRSNDYHNEWDGGNSPVGAYGYYIKGTDRQGQLIEFRGYVSIVR